MNSDTSVLFENMPLLKTRTIVKGRPANFSESVAQNFQHFCLFNNFESFFCTAPNKTSMGVDCISQLREELKKKTEKWWSMNAILE